MKKKPIIKQSFRTKLKRVDDCNKVTIDKTPGVESVELERQKRPLFLEKNKNLYKMDRKSRNFFKKHGDKAYLITIRFLNGTRKTFAIKTDNQTFTIKKKLYFVYYEEAWYDLTMNQYHLDYLENCAVPLNREVVKQGEEAFFSVNPDNLQHLIKFEYVKALAGAGSLDKMLRTILVLSFIQLIGLLLVVVLSWGKGATT